MGDQGTDNLAARREHAEEQEGERIKHIPACVGKRRA